jgi:hypothetical protein
MSAELRREAMRRKRRNHSPSFKAKVALAALKGDLTPRVTHSPAFCDRALGPREYVYLRAGKQTTTEARDAR